VAGGDGVLVGRYRAIAVSEVGQQVAEIVGRRRRRLGVV
jgi:hypothetical protein